jgi:quinohemoprotein ethanol dehydrogenase
MLVIAGLGLMVLPPSVAAVVDGNAIADETQGTDWLSGGRTYTESHYSPLAEINDRNVARLGLAWFLDLRNEGPLQATPLAVNGVLYFSGSNGRVYAVDARSGREQWTFDPDLVHHAPRLTSYGANRGVAYWKDKVYVGTVDGRLVALNARTGKVAWSVQTFDEPNNDRKYISGAPRVFRDKVIIGHGGEGGRGYVTAYDASSGKRRWRFYTVPGDPAKGFENPTMAMAAKTWTGQWWKDGGNATVWEGITYDPELNRIYLGTANGTPWNVNVRSGRGDDCLFTNSIIALDAETGAYLWHYQETPRGAFDYDYDATEQMVLANLDIGGKHRKVLMQASKNGFFYVIDRVTGKLISAKKFSKANWAERIDLGTGRPVEAVQDQNGGSRAIWPSIFGAHAWAPMSFNSATSLMYIPTMKFGMRVGKDVLELGPQDPDDLTGGLLAWDPVAQKKAWQVQYADSFWNGGTLSTAGDLVFQGTARGQFIAYNARTGEKLWSYYAGLGISGAPITYTIDGVQYVSVLVGYGGNINMVGMTGDLDAIQRANYGWHFNEQPRRVLVFALGGQLPLPPGEPPRFTVRAVDDPRLAIDVKESAKGATLYEDSCPPCHGINLMNIGAFSPDLRESRGAMNWEAFRAVVQEGNLAAFGMPKFGALTDEEIRSIYMYIRKSAREAASPVKGTSATRVGG